MQNRVPLRDGHDFDALIEVSVAACAGAEGLESMTEIPCIIYSMSPYDKLLSKILRGTSDANIPFSELCALLEHLGFDERIRGSHHIFTHADADEILNLQPTGSKAKIYQVKQARNLILKYHLGGSDD